MIKISIIIKGGLGNQLFQIFTLISLAKERGLEYVIVKHDNSPSCTPRRTYWNDLFSKQIKLVENLEENWTKYQEPIKKHYLYINFPEFRKNTILDGYFQNPLYFKNLQSDIFNYIQLKKEDEIIVQNKLKEIKEIANKKKLIFVHIRRGDYLKFNLCLKIDYYFDSIQTFDQDKTFFIFFSDDILYCKKTFSQIKNKYFVEMEDYLELMLMSWMDGGIIANSTFSWWGQYLIRCRQEKDDIPVLKPTNFGLSLS